MAQVLRVQAINRWKKIKNNKTKKKTRTKKVYSTVQKKNEASK